MCSRRCVLLLLALVSSCMGQVYNGICDKGRNAGLPFCDSGLPFDTRVRDFIGRLTLDEKIANLVHDSTGATASADMDPYWWWGEALHGVSAWGGGAHFRPPTEYSTSFPQVLNLAASFNKQLFFEVGNATGNEARVFYNAGNAGLTFWSPTLNIYRDPRWGRGQETPGEDPYLSSVYAGLFVRGLQGGTSANGFLKTSACCKHFAAHSMEEGRGSFNSIVTDQDMADSYLPAFKSCVQANATCVMTAYNAIHGVPMAANKALLTDLVRDEWGFDGYVVTDCWGIFGVIYDHHYTNTEADTCRAVLDAGVDIECGDFYTFNLRNAVSQGVVTESMLDTALFRGYKVLMRAGYFEKDDTRPYKELQPNMVDSDPHKELALNAARQSIVLLKNSPNGRTGLPPLPLDHKQFKERRASMALIGPHLWATYTFQGNYHASPSFTKAPIEEIRKYVPDLEFEFGCELYSFEDSHLEEAEDLARDSSQVVLFVGISGEYEGEDKDRPNITLPGLQTELIRRVLAVVQEPVILVFISGGALDLSEWKNHPKVGAIIWAGYIGQSGGEAIADVIFGSYNPSGRMTQTLYANEYLNQVNMSDMNLRPGNESPGRTYRFFTGEPVYPFGYGLSYTTFDYSLMEVPDATCVLKLDLTVRNLGSRPGDHSVLLYLAPPNAGQLGRPIKSLFEFEKLMNLAPNEARQLQVCLNRDNFQLANERGEFEVVNGEWKLMVGSLERNIMVLG